MTRHIVLFAAALSTLAANAQSITYQWLNQPCANILNCDEGCTACNLPEDSPGVFLGTNVAWIGVGTCPHPIASGDNAVYSTGWSVLPSADRYILMSGVAVADMHIDTIAIRYASWEGGPQRAKVLFTNNIAAAMEEIGDVPSLPEFTTTTFTDLGCIEIPEGSTLASFQLKLVPYESETGGWALDEVRIVASPCQAAQVGIEEFSRTNVITGPYVDIMGRPVKDEKEQPAPGVYIRGRKQVQVF